MPETKAGNETPTSEKKSREPVDEAAAPLGREHAERRADDYAEDQRGER